MLIRRRSWFLPCLQALLKGAIALLLVGQSAAFSGTVHWEEEVLLNTGEIIWVNKEVSYSMQGQAGNPLDLGYRPDRVEITSFKYGGKDYTYKGDASIFVLAISPQKIPAFIAIPDNFDWDYRNKYRCVIPYYVQLNPDATGQTWSWPEKIDTWAYNLPANLYVNRDAYLKTKTKYTLEDKSQQMYLRDRRLDYLHKVKPTNVGERCPGAVWP